MATYTQRLEDLCINYTYGDQPFIIQRLTEDIREWIKSPNADLSQWIDKPLNNGWTFLMVMAHKGYVDVVKYLLDIPNEQVTPTYSPGSKKRFKIDLFYTSPSGATVFDVVHPDNKKLVDLLKGLKKYKQALKDGPVFEGYHETSQRAFEFIVGDMKHNRFPMVGGARGYFGGGIYFAATEKESSRKALHGGFGLKCKLKMGNILKISNQDEYYDFKRNYCDEDDPYETPADVMREYLWRFGEYTSVWGHKDESIEDVDKRILRTGDEYVVYSPDQAEPIEGFFIDDPPLPFQTITSSRNIIKQWVPLKTSLTSYDRSVVEITHTKARLFPYIIPHRFIPSIPQLETDIQTTLESGDIIEYSFKDPAVERQLHLERFIPVAILFKTKSFDKQLFYDDLMTNEAVMEKPFVFRDFLYNNAKVLTFTYKAFQILTEFHLSHLEFFHKYYQTIQTHNTNPVAKYKLWLDVPNKESVPLDYSFLKENLFKNLFKNLSKKIKEKINVDLLLKAFSNNVFLYTDGTELYFIGKFHINIYIYPVELRESSFIAKTLASCSLRGCLRDRIEKMIKEGSLQSLIETIPDHNYTSLVLKWYPLIVRYQHFL